MGSDPENGKLLTSFNYFNVSDSATGKADKKVVGLLKEDKRLRKKVDEIFSVFRV